MENADFEQQFQGLSTPEKIQLLSESKPYRDMFDPLHKAATRYMLELHSDPSSAAPVPLPDNLTDIMAHPGFNSALHPDHKRIMKKFQELHGIK